MNGRVEKKFSKVIIGLFLFVNIFAAAAAIALPDETYYQYDLLSDLPHLNSVNLRQKRQAVPDLKNQYQSVSSQNGTASDAKATGTGVANPSTEKSTETSVVVPIANADRQLGVNGTGQLKEVTTDGKVKPTNLGASADNADAAGASKKYPKKVMAAPIPAAAPVPAAAPTENHSDEKALDQDQEKVIGNVDVSEDEARKDIENHNLKVNETVYHDYYNSTMYVDKAEADLKWIFMANITHNSMLSQSHRRAMTVELSFDFPFYGHPVRNITVATGGFLYTGEYVHSWLAATQYIAPLMANFDTSLSNDSFVRLNDNGTAFTVVWENVTLQDKPNVGKFTFSTTLHKNGDICFAYYSVPILIHSIQDDKHPVKVGLSDAYIMDKAVFYARRKTIYEYHRVSFASVEITNSTIIYLTALPTCLSYKDCQSCINHDTSFKCVWCPAMNRCSNGTDRQKQEWLQMGCDRGSVSDTATCPAIGQKGNNAPQANSSNSSSGGSSSESTTSASTTNTDNHSGSPEQAGGGGSSSSPTQVAPVTKEMKASLEGADNEKPKSMGMALGFMLPICLLVSLSLWVLYAYRNPHTKSGQLLIQYRPAQWTWRRGEARYTAATIHM